VLNLVFLEAEIRMASTVWKGYLTFDLISVPIRLFVAARTERIPFNQIHGKCDSRIKQQTCCPACECVVERGELKKGFEVAKGRFVIAEEDDITKIAPQSNEAMEILEFVKVAEIDPIYFDASYLMAPEDAGKRAYELLFQAMRKSGFSAIAKIAMHQREYTVVIRPYSQGLTLHTMFYPEEVRNIPEFGKDPDVQIRPQEIALAEQLVETLAAEFDPRKYRDEYQMQLAALIESKKQGSEIKGVAPRKLAPVIDLVQALQQSLRQTSSKKPATNESGKELESSKRPPKRQRAARQAGVA
jgi:DNA end-binding protein Ku